jgi:putative DNA primase/helicase
MSDHETPRDGEDSTPDDSDLPPPEAYEVDEVRATGGRHTIEIRAGELAEAVDLAEAALLAADAGIFQRGGQLVRVVQSDPPPRSAKNAVTRAIGTPIIVPLTREFLLLVLSRHVTFLRYDARAEQLRRVDPPAMLAAMLLAAGEWQFRRLRGVVCAPTLRSDGSLLSAPGYDPDSGLLLWDDGTVWPEINPRPSQSEASEALAVLRDLLREFEFVGGRGGPHESVALAAIITATVRHALPIAPGFAVDAHKMGSGKTELVHTVSRVLTGRDASVMPLADTEEEIRKALLALLIAGDPIALIDNIEQPVSSAALNAALTSEMYRDRILGESRTVAVPTAATFMFTGNNLQFVGDLTSRIMVSGLDPQCEQPGSREFNRDLKEYVMAHRAELLGAALTIPLGYLTAGAPSRWSPSRFHAWDRLVRAPLQWLGCPDPLATQEEMRAVDPVRTSLLEMLQAWGDVFGDRPATVAEAINAASGPLQIGHPGLAAAIEQAGARDRGGAFNARSLGRWLARFVRRIEGGRRFERNGEDSATCRPRYRVVSVSGVSSVSPNGRAENGSDNYMGWAATNAENAGNAAGGIGAEEIPL